MDDLNGKLIAVIGDEVKCSLLTPYFLHLWKHFISTWNRLPLHSLFLSIDRIQSLGLYLLVLGIEQRRVKTF